MGGVDHALRYADQVSGGDLRRMIDGDRWVSLFDLHSTDLPTRALGVNRDLVEFPDIRIVDDGLLLSDPPLLAKWHDNALVMFLESTSYPARQMELRRLTSLYKPPAQPSIGRLKKAAPLCCEWSDNFWHWMTEYLPYALDLETLGFDGVYLVPGRSRLVTQTLLFFGIPSEKIVEREFDIYAIDEMVVPNRSEGQKAGHPALFKALRESARAKIGPVTQTLRLYIGRRDQRVVRNEAEVLATLVPLGFSAVFMEDHPIEEQIRLACAADCICGPHGAGMTASIFMAEGAKVIEFFSPTYVNPCMLGTSEVLGHTYAMVTSRVYREAPYPYGLDVLVDLPSLEATLRTVLGSAKAPTIAVTRFEALIDRPEARSPGIGDLGFMTVDSSEAKTELCRLGASFGTDKSPYLANEGGHRHGYTAIYDMLLASRRYEPLVMAEIGVHNNASMRLWRAYLKNATLYGFELNEQLIHYARAERLARVHYAVMDAGDAASVFQAFNDTGETFDVIIDDSSHFFDHQTTIVPVALQFLRPGGMLVVEDIFRPWPRARYVEALRPCFRYFASGTFIDAQHRNKFSGGHQEPWYDNDRLLLLVRNEIEYRA